MSSPRRPMVRTFREFLVKVDHKKIDKDWTEAKTEKTGSKIAKERNK